MSVRTATAPPAASPAAPVVPSRLQHVLDVGAALASEEAPSSTGFLRRLSSKSEDKPEPSAQAKTVVAFLERFWYKQRAEAQGQMDQVAAINVDLNKSWGVVEETIKKANIGRTSKQSHRVTPTYDEALWLAASATAGDATWGEELDNVKRIGMQLWADLNTLPEKEGSVVLGRLVACNWWWHRFETDPKVGVEQDAAAAEKYEARLRELHEMALQAFRGQYEAGKKGKDACSKVYTKCTHVDFTFDEMMNTAKAKLLVTEWGYAAMYKDKERNPPGVYAAGGSLFNMYTI